MKPEPLQLDAPGTFGLKFASDFNCGRARRGVAVEWGNINGQYIGGVMTNEQVKQLIAFLQTHLEYVDGK